mgnify:CR=1 FL=1
MAERKIFAGPKVRRIRNALALTQTAMAEALEISPSYLNLIERNQRPLTVQLLLKLSSVYRIDLEELRGETAGGLGQLKEVFADPLRWYHSVCRESIDGTRKAFELVNGTSEALTESVGRLQASTEQAGSKIERALTTAASRMRDAA